MTSRRTFLKYVGGTTLTLFTYNKFGIKQALAEVPGGTLNPAAVPKFQTPMLIPPVMPKAGVIKQKRGKNIDYYEISMKQFAQQILPAGQPATTVWGYGAVNGAGSKRPLLIHNAPSLTIEAQYNRPVRVKWINNLIAANGDHLPHLLPVDQTLHWASPPGGTNDRDSRPRRGRRGRRERRLHRGLVLARSG
jgi:spore coat protein A